MAKEKYKEENFTIRIYKDKITTHLWNQEEEFGRIGIHREKEENKKISAAYRKMALKLLELSIERENLDKENPEKFTKNAVKKQVNKMIKDNELLFESEDGAIVVDISDDFYKFVKDNILT